MDTNYQHYFGTPEKASQMRVTGWIQGDEGDGEKEGIFVYKGDELIADLCIEDGESFESWLYADCGVYKKPVTIEIDGAKFALAQLRTGDRKMVFDIHCEVPIDNENYRLVDFSSYRITGAITVSEC